MRLKEGLRLSLVGDGYVIYDSQREIIITLNITSSFLLEMLLEGMDTQDIIREYSRTFQVSEKIARRDLESFLEQMR